MIQFYNSNFYFAAKFIGMNIDVCETSQEESTQFPVPSLCFVADLSIKMTGAERIKRPLQGVCYSGEPFTNMIVECPRLVIG